jgi:D-alanine-D-alanine ligase
MSKKIIILFSETPENAGEDDQDTLIQVQSVSNALSGVGYEPVPMPFMLNLTEMRDKLRKISPDMVFNLVESANGQGRLISVAPLLLETLGIPYTGADADAMFLTSNKVLAKQLLHLSGIDTPRWVAAKDLKKETSFVEGTYIIKSVWEHASIGLAQDSIVCIKNSSELKAVMAVFQERLGGECFAEEYIEGREFNLSVLDREKSPQVLPPAEIRFEGFSEEQFKIVDYNAKWKEASSEYHSTVRSFEFSSDDDPLLERLKDISIKCWNIFNLRGYARVDFRVDSAGKPFVLEVNANPCISPDAGFAAALEKAGISYSAAIERILKNPNSGRADSPPR